MNKRGGGGGENNVKKEEGREALRRLKPIWGCNASERRRRINCNGR